MEVGSPSLCLCTEWEDSKSRVLGHWVDDPLSGRLGGGEEWAHGVGFEAPRPPQGLQGTSSRPPRGGPPQQQPLQTRPRPRDTERPPCGSHISLSAAG